MTIEHTDTAAPVAPVPAVQSPFRRFAADFLESGIARVALFTLLAIVVLALAAPWITPQNPCDPAQVDVMDGRLLPGEEAFAGCRMWPGSDGAGRDLYSAILYGLRISLAVGVGGITLMIGSLIGLFAAYAGGRVETIIMRLVDLQLSFPAPLIAHAIALEATLSFLGDRLRDVLNPRLST